MPGSDIISNFWSRKRTLAVTWRREVSVGLRGWTSAQADGEGVDLRAERAAERTEPGDTLCGSCQGGMVGGWLLGLVLGEVREPCHYRRLGTHQKKTVWGREWQVGLIQFCTGCVWDICGASGSRLPAESRKQRAEVDVEAWSPHWQLKFWGQHVEWAEKGPGLGGGDKHCTPSAVWEQRHSGDMAKEQLLIPRSGRGEETPKVSLPSCLSAGQAWKPFIGFIIFSNISSSYYANCIHTYKTIAYLLIFLHTKKEPKCQALSITDFFANTISLVKVFSSFLLPFLSQHASRLPQKFISHLCLHIYMYPNFYPLISGTCLPGCSLFLSH